MTPELPSEIAAAIRHLIRQELCRVGLRPPPPPCIACRWDPAADQWVVTVPLPDAPPADTGGATAC